MKSPNVYSKSFINNSQPLTLIPPDDIYTKNIALTSMYKIMNYLGFHVVIVPPLKPDTSYNFFSSLDVRNYTRKIDRLFVNVPEDLLSRILFVVLYDRIKAKIDKLKFNINGQIYDLPTIIINYYVKVIIEGSVKNINFDLFIVIPESKKNKEKIYEYIKFIRTLIIQLEYPIIKNLFNVGIKSNKSRYEFDVNKILNFLNNQIKAKYPEFDSVLTFLDSFNRTLISEFKFSIEEGKKTYAASFGTEYLLNLEDALKYTKTIKNKIINKIKKIDPITFIHEYIKNYQIKKYRLTYPLSINFLYIAFDPDIDDLSQLKYPIIKYKTYYDYVVLEIKTYFEKSKKDLRFYYKPESELLLDFFKLVEYFNQKNKLIRLPPFISCDDIFNLSVYPEINAFMGLIRKN